MDLGLDGARALVGGGSGGLGGAIAAALAGEGARVAPGRAAVGPAGCRRRRGWPGAVAVAEDLVDARTGRLGAVAAAVEALGGLDLLLVNSGGPPPGTFDELDEAAWQRAIDGTLRSALRLIRAALPHLRASDRPAHPRHPVVVGARADPRADDVQPAPPRAGRPHQVADRGDRPGPHQRPRARAGRDRPHRPDRRGGGRSGPARRRRRSPRRSIGRIPLGRYGDPAEVGRLGRLPAVARPRRTSPAPSCRSMAAWSGACPDAPGLPVGRAQPVAEGAPAADAVHAAGRPPVHARRDARVGARRRGAAPGGGHRHDVHAARREPREPRTRPTPSPTTTSRSSTRSRRAGWTARSRSSRPSSASTTTRTGRSPTWSGSPSRRPRPGRTSGSTWRAAPTSRRRSGCTSGSGRSSRGPASASRRT